MQSYLQLCLGVAHGAVEPYQRIW